MSDDHHDHDVGDVPFWRIRNVQLAVVAVVHPTMLWLTQKEPRATELYLRNRGYADFYQPHADARADLGGPASLRAPTHRPRPTLPPLT